MFNVNVTHAQQTMLCADPDKIVPGSLAGELTESLEVEDKIETSKAEEELSDLMITADEIKVDDKGVFEFRGNPIIDGPKFLLESKSILLDNEKEIFHADAVRLKVFKESDEDSSQIRLLARAISESLKFEFGVFMLKQATFTHCPENNSDVLLVSPDIQLDTNTGFGKARHATLKFKNVPIFYFPVLMFPITNKRESGFLFPNAGFNRDSGLSVNVPYYVNIAPNADATLSTNIIAKRGVQLQTELRHLGKHSDTQISGEYLAKDRVLKNVGSRKAVLIDSRWHNQQRFYSLIDIEWLSDTNYFSDFSGIFDERDSLYVNQSAQFNFVSTNFSASLGFDKFSSSDTELTEEDLPPERLPWVSVQKDFGLTDRTNWKTILAYDKFRHTKTPSGTRVRVDSFIEHEQKLGFLLVRHKLGGSQLTSRVDKSAKHNAEKTSVSSLFYSIDTSMAFDQTHSSSDDGKWTIEPRLKLTLAKQVDQSSLPRFNTEKFHILNFSDLFLDTAYVGNDRVLNTNIASAGITWSYHSLDYTGYVMRFSLGAIDFPSIDPKNVEAVQLREENLGYFISAERKTSGTGQNLGILFDRESGKISQATASVTWQIKPKTQFRSFFKSIRDDEQIGVVLESNLNPYWTMEIAHELGLDDSPLRNTEVVFEHTSCCWGASLSFERTVNSKGIEDDSVQLNFDLTGFWAI